MKSPIMAIDTMIKQVDWMLNSTPTKDRLSPKTIHELHILRESLLTDIKCSKCTKCSQFKPGEGHGAVDECKCRVTKIWVEYESWDCGDGCCSDSWYNVCTDDNTLSYELRKCLSSKEDAIYYLKAEYPHCEVDIDKIKMSPFVGILHDRT